MIKKWFRETDSEFGLNSQKKTVNSDSIHYLFREFTLNSLSFSFWIAYLLCEFTVNSLCFRELTFNVLFWFPYLGEFNSKSPSFSRIQFKFTLNTLSVSRNHFIFIIFFANSVRIHYLFHEITLNFYLLCEFNSNALFISQIHIDSTMFFANPL